MRTVYGLKLFMLDDIVGKTGGRPDICNFLKKNPEILKEFEDEEKLEIDTGLRKNFPIYNMAKCLRFVFLSIDLLEERLILDNLVKNMEEVSKILLTIDRAQKVERIVNKHKDSYEKFSNKYSGEALIKQPCFMFVYDNDSEEEKLIDVYTVIPEEVILLLTTPIEYKCSDCGTIMYTNNTSFDQFMPDIYYKVTENQIDYRCENHKEAGYSHVGDKPTTNQ